MGPRSFVWCLVPLATALSNTQYHDISSSDRWTTSITAFPPPQGQQMVYYDLYLQIVIINGSVGGERRWKAWSQECHRLKGCQSRIRGLLSHTQPVDVGSQQWHQVSHLRSIWVSLCPSWPWWSTRYHRVVTLWVNLVSKECWHPLSQTSLFSLDSQDIAV